MEQNSILLCLLSDDTEYPSILEHRNAQAHLFLAYKKKINKENENGQNHSTAIFFDIVVHRPAVFPLLYQK